jgi:hypothetical protein
LVESLRREKLAEGDIRKLEAEIKHLSRLVIIYSYIRQSSRILNHLPHEQLLLP